MTTLTDKQAARLQKVEMENRLETLFTDLAGVVPSIISPDREPFAVFRPETTEEYSTLLTKLQPTGQNFELGFAGKNPIPTFSPYSIHYGGNHETPNYMDVTVKFIHSICPVWIKIPKDVQKVKFSVTRKDGKHRGFGRYENVYSLKANGGTTVQNYYGDNKTMYAANEREAKELKDFIFNVETVNQ